MEKLKTPYLHFPYEMGRNEVISLHSFLLDWHLISCSLVSSEVVFSIIKTDLFFPACIKPIASLGSLANGGLFIGFGFYFFFSYQFMVWVFVVVVPSDFFLFFYFQFFQPIFFYFFHILESNCAPSVVLREIKTAIFELSEHKEIISRCSEALWSLLCQEICYGDPGKVSERPVMHSFEIVWSPWIYSISLGGNCIWGWETPPGSLLSPPRKYFQSVLMLQGCFIYCCRSELGRHSVVQPKVSTSEIFFGVCSFFFFWLKHYSTEHQISAFLRCTKCSIHNTLNLIFQW